ncbi:amino acid adenylation domain-containing protein [Amycolatopsis pigmentata]|uniref:Amino acid adenylation domain-containing protein n=1 Tax=Amycolatopsis pigmentata TaxID=450801 RepID=A0ABW5FL53_9PSEU
MDDQAGRMHAERNGTARRTTGETLPGHIERQVRRDPGGVAVVRGAESLSYRELNVRANRLAHALIARGAGPEKVVSVCLPRSVELVVALVAVLKAGAAYLPIDPDYPPERIAFMQQDVRVVARIDERTFDGAVGYPETDPTDADRSVPLTAAHPAYVIYTSGSTGRPKGVVVPHHGVVGYLAHLRERTGLGPGDTVLNLASVSFDPSVRDIFGPLTAGATLAMVPPEEAKDPQALLAALNRHRVTVLPALVPTMLSALADAAEATGTAPSPWLRVGLVSGEELTLAHTRRAGALGTAWRLINQYGPTECTMVATSHPVDGEPGPRIPIGRPIPNARCYVLDERLRPVAPGTVGELYLGGDEIARGYAGRPALTAERFPADPHGVPGSRMYRTGDLARRRADGALEFHGRVDDQVKLRGNRVELGEIQAVLAGFPGVAQAAVSVREDRPGDQRLVGYVVGPFEPARLRAYLGDRLPGYMIPSAFVALDALPLSPNGKLDRARLPAPEITGTERTPESERERILCELFADVLGVRQVGPDDDFFVLGGHSLLVFRLISRIRSVLDAEVRPHAVFEAPSPAALLDRLDGGSATRRPISRMKRPELVPLSLAQRRLWFLHRFDGPNPAYNVVWAVRMSGELDRSALTGALGDVLARHESLRTVFFERDGEPYQLVLGTESARPVLSIVDVDEAGLDGAVAVAAARPFDLAAEIPLRVSLFSLGEHEQVLLVVMHHIAADGGSIVPLVRDLSAAYTARRAGQRPDLPSPRVQYADFALWQREHLGGTDGDDANPIARQLEYWRRTLDGSPELLELPTDRPRLAEAGYRGDRVRFTVDSASYRKLAGLARETGTTVFMVLHAALAALLTRLGSGTDIPVGTVLAGRDDETTEDVVGFFVNTVVLRTDTSGDPSFRALLRRVRETDLAAYANQDVPFERLVEALNPARSVSHTPLFQVILTYDSGADIRPELPGLSVEPYLAGSGTTKFDLSFFVWETATTIEGYLDYATDLFDAVTAEELVTRLVRLLCGALAEPDAPISRIDLLSSSERHELLVACNETDIEVPDAVLPELFATQVRRVPGAPAVAFEDETLTYAELDARANRLARMLVRAGVGPERFVAVALPKSTDLVVAMLAVLTAGAAYVAVDLSYPQERIAFMLDDVDPVLVLTSTEVAGTLPVDGNLVVLDDPHTAAVLDALPGEAVTDDERTHPLRPRNPAFAIYTSGSTGRPKGVVVEHHSLNHYLAWARDAYPGVAGRALVHSSVSFDLTVTGLYATLTAGGCVHLIDLDENAARKNPVRPTFVKATPSHLPLLIALPGRFSPTEQLVLGGEPLLGEVLDEWRTKHPDVTVFNEYGPTETTVECMDCRILPGETVPPGVVTLGYASWNTQMYVLDAALRPVPVGVAGEIYIAGELVTRGYHRRPALTAGRYVANPFGPPGSRMYRSGDLARRCRDGRLEFLARVDDQVKVRGFRIELGEIEAVLGQDPAVAHVAVIVREDRPGDRRLVAYFVPAERATAVDTAALRARCAEYLPEYMVPSAFVAMDVLPLTPNRKLDRRSLPVPVYEGDASRRAPRSAQEEILCGLFAEALGIPAVGIDDNFFALGGHSLLAVRLISRIRSTFGAELSLRVLFESPTVLSLVDHLSHAEKARPALRSMPRPEEVG